MGNAHCDAPVAASGPVSCSFGGSKRSSLGSDTYAPANVADSRLRRPAAEDEMSTRKSEWQARPLSL